MSLTATLTEQVDSKVRAKGRSYYHSGCVTIHTGDPKRVSATVRGSMNYRVALVRDKHRLRAACTCPYFEDWGVCKHIWATLLAADSRGYLRPPGGSTPEYIEEDDALLDRDDSVTDDESEDSAEFHDGWEPRRESKKAAPPPPNWKQLLAPLRNAATERPGYSNSSWPAGREIVYVVDGPGSSSGRGLSVHIAYRERKRDGNWSKLKNTGYLRLSNLPDPDDRQTLTLLGGSVDYSGSGYGGYSYANDSVSNRFCLSSSLHEIALPWMCATNRCFLRPTNEKEDLRELRWDDGPPWDFWLVAAADEAGKNYLLSGELRRGEERLDLAAPILLVKGGLVFHEGRAARLNDRGDFEWIGLLRRSGTLTVPVKQGDQLLKELLALPRLPRLELPEPLRFEEVTLTPRPRLTVKKENSRYYRTNEFLRGELSFDYDGWLVLRDHPGTGSYQAEQRRLVRRDQGAEAAAFDRLLQAGFSYQNDYGLGHALRLKPRQLPKVVGQLLAEGWHVEAEGKLFRSAGNFNIEVSSGIDWFELHGGVEFGDTQVALPELLAAIRKGETTVRLDDGTFGMLPEEWLKKYGLLAGLGKPHEDHLRFGKTQIGLLDALLAAQPEATCDAVFQKARDELRHFDGIEPTDPPDGFTGQLRAYQRDGLGWLHFLQRFGFGGCLADDMGLGKTVQVLGLLEARRQRRTSANGKRGAEQPPPSLVVVPRSLVFNWKQEAARFTPGLRVLDHTGIARQKPGEHFHEHDLVLTTYGTLRRDAADLKDFRFDYCILDEAQAIKNAASESAKAARLLQADHRLIMSGTPVENHLGELWSLFEFLNPGMLGSASVFKLGGVGARSPEPETRDLLARALRPFILRRTKEQVAKDLPEKTEQTLYCELDATQRKLYDQLRDHFRQSLLGRIEEVGLNRAKIQVLEALLRLRQAACHPGLIDKKKASESSAKLEALLPQLAEVIDEGHKVLVFSQFTQFLAIVRDRLDREKVVYEYLDGRTRDRQAKVERFQNDPNCKLFLISLKAGGLGLNLTAAEYVFLLDPWWNPAVEAQAIDRAHRIGQERPVFAYRLIAKGTVEEKVLELQKTKRDLADAIVNADNSLIRNLGREDLELLLS